MKKLNKVLIGALAAQIVLIAAVWASRDTSTISDPRPVMAGFDDAAVERLEIYESLEAGAEGDGGEPTPVVVLARSDDGVVLESAHGYPADAERFDELLAGIGRMESRDPIATSEGRARQLEVADDAYDRKLVFHLEGGDKRTVFLGTPAGRGEIAARVGGERAIHGVESSVGKPVKIREKDWVKQPFFEVDSERIERLSLDGEGVRAAFVRGDDGWTLDEEASAIAAPEGELVSPSAVDDLAHAASKVSVDTVAAAEPGSEHGLDEPRVRVELTLAPVEEEGDGESANISLPEQMRTILLGADEGQRVYVRDADRSFVVLTRRNSVADLLNASAEELFATQEEIDEQKQEEEEAAQGPPGGMPGGMPGGAMPMPGGRGAGGAMVPPGR